MPSRRSRAADRPMAMARAPNTTKTAVAEAIRGSKLPSSRRMATNGGAGPALRDGMPRHTPRPYWDARERSSSHQRQTCASGTESRARDCEPDQDHPVTIRPATVADQVAIAELNAMVQQMHHDVAPEWFKPPEMEAIVDYFGQALRSEALRAFVVEADGTTRSPMYPTARTVLTRRAFRHHGRDDRRRRRPGVPSLLPGAQGRRAAIGAPGRGGRDPGCHT